MSSQLNAVMIFHSIHKIMKAEKVLRKANLTVRLMPVPRQLSSDCGLSVAFRLKDFETARSCLEAAKCTFEEVYVLEGDTYKRLA